MQVIKECTKCNIKKDSILFYKYKRSRDGFSTWCKDCSNSYRNTWRINNLERNRAIVRKSSKKYRNTEQGLKNRIKHEQLETTKKLKVRYMMNRAKNNPYFRVIRNLRARFRMALNRNYKSGSAIKDLGCSIEDLKWWLEFWFNEGMNWNNYGNKKGQWSIDHIKPLSKFDLTNRDQLLEVCNYKNLQPMWHRDNLSKGAK